ncbi:MAG: hypothetical protein KTR29_16365 [Rhodothermaceae bacterium]|nr:hypothetical protein [Rhodothermaceae bacterium]
MDFFLSPESIDATGWLIRATILLAAGIILTVILQRFAAQARHLVWTVIFSVMLVLPLGMFWLPAWEVAVLPPTENTMAPDLAYLEVAEAPIAVEDPAAVSGHVKAPYGTLSLHNNYAHEATPEVLRVDPFSRTFATIFWVWVIGVISALVSLLVGKLRFLWLTHKAESVLDPDWTDQFDKLKRQLGISRDVRLLMSNAISTPMTSGSLRPVILVPDSALTWSEDRIQMVLAHELIHVRRYDALRHFVSKITLSMYWFHPLSWIASRMASICREQACDAEVLLLGTRPSAYASELLTLADDMIAEPSYAVLPMIRKSQLEKRLMAILDPNRPKKNLVANGLLFLLVSTLGIATVIARPVHSLQATSELPAVATLPQEAPETPLAPEAPVPLAASQPPSAEAAPKPVAAPESIEPSALEMLPRLAKPISEAHMTIQEDYECEVNFRGSLNKKDNFTGSFSTGRQDGVNRNQYSGKLNSDRVVQMMTGDIRLCMRMHGDIEIDDDGRVLITTNPNSSNDVDSWMVVEAEDSKLYKMVITGGGQGLERTWSIDGEIMEIEDNTEAWMRQVISILNNYADSRRLLGKASSYRGEISSLRGEVSSMRGRLSSNRGRVSSLRGEISALRGHESSLRGEISSIRGHESSLRGEISSLRGHLSSLRASNRDVDEDKVAEFKARIAAIEADIKEYNAEQREEEIKQKIAGFDTEAKIAEIQKKIEAFQLEEKERRAEEEIKAFNLKEKVAEIDKKLVELDAGNRSEAMEKEIKEQIKGLKKLMRSM